MAWNALINWFWLNMKQNKMIQYDYADVALLYANHITFPYEILTSFLNEHQLNPTFLWAHQDWGTWNPETRQWNGAAAMVREDLNCVLVLLHNS